MERQEAIMVSDERVYICNPCDQTLERCADCDQPERLRGWRYEPAVRICEGCFEDRDREEEREEI
jgi:hypothetical protein